MSYCFLTKWSCLESQTQSIHRSSAFCHSVMRSADNCSAASQSVLHSLGAEDVQCDDGYLSGATEVQRSRSPHEGKGARRNRQSLWESVKNRNAYVIRQLQRIYDLGLKQDVTLKVYDEEQGTAISRCVSLAIALRVRSFEADELVNR